MDVTAHSTRIFIGEKEDRAAGNGLADLAPLSHGGQGLQGAHETRLNQGMALDTTELIDSLKTELQRHISQDDAAAWHHFLTSRSIPPEIIHQTLQQLDAWSCQNCTRLNSKVDPCLHCGEARDMHRGSINGSSEVELPRLVASMPCPSGQITPGGRTLLGYDDGMQKHKQTPDVAFDVHPERPDRLHAAYEHLERLGLIMQCEVVSGRSASEAELSRVHCCDYLQSLNAAWQQPPGRLCLSHDTYSSGQGSKEAALLACGIAVEVVDRVVQGRARNGFALVRPPGHHAEKGKAMGFCMLNNVAVAAEHARRKYNLKRILIVDWDVHHGNGTQHIFNDDSSVLYCSIHRLDHGDFFPGSGRPCEIGMGQGIGHTINVAWTTAGAGDAEYLLAFDQLLMPVFMEYCPELVLISAGFDAGLGDPLGGCSVTSAGFAHMAHRLCSLACGKVVAVLEGGYNLKVLSKGIEAVLRTLLGHPPPRLQLCNKPSPEGVRAIARTRKFIRPYWKTIQADFPPAAEEAGDVSNIDGARVVVKRGASGANTYIFYDVRENLPHKESNRQQEPTEQRSDSSLEQKEGNADLDEGLPPPSAAGETGDEVHWTTFPPLDIPILKPKQPSQEFSYSQFFGVEG